MAADSDARKRVVFLIRSLEYGGAERQLAVLAAGMDRGRFEPVVVSFYGGVFEEDLQQAGVKAICLQVTNRWDILRSLPRLLGTIRALKPDVLHGYLEAANILVVLFKLFLPRTRTVLGVWSSDMDLRPYDWMVRFTFVLQTWLSRFADCVILNSEEARRYWVERGFPAKKCVVIPNGVDIHHFTPAATTNNSLRKRWNIPGDALLVGVVGRIDPVKGLETFIQAAGLVAQRLPDVYFVCVGSGAEDYTAGLQELAGKEIPGQRLVWEKAQRDIAPVYQSLDVACLPSNSESLPNVILEAMSCGLPVVATRVGDVPLLVQDENRLAPPGDPRALADALQFTLELPVEERRRQGALARRRIVDYYSNSQFTARTQDVFESLLAQQGL